MNKPTPTYSDSKQTMWETWFVTSLVLVIVLFILGLMESSKEFIPEWPYIFGLVVANLCYCLFIGRTKS